MQVHQPSSLTLTLDTLNGDVLRLIVDHLHPAALPNLASSSHKFRDICLPVLLSRCTVDIRRHVIDHSNPPEEVCVHVRHLTHLGCLGEEQSVKYFEALLDRLPSLQSVTIKCTAGQIPWGIWKACFSRPHIESLSYRAGPDDLAIPPFPSDEVEATRVPLQRFSYTTTIWREMVNGTEGQGYINFYHQRPISMQPVFEFERECLSAIVLRMNETAVSLTLPLESTSVIAMTELSWPNLKELNLHGRFLDVSQVKHSTLPAITPLPCTPFDPRCSDAREIAYPDPADDIFSIPMPMLSHLALRDQPRIYHNYARCPVGEGPMMEHWHTPVLLDREILYILQRMEFPRLTSLEIVYHVTEEDSDHELLSYIVDALPHLEHLEIHRYRRRRSMLTQHKPIAKILSAAQALRTVRLNLDFHDDTQAYCGNPLRRDLWFRTLRDVRGPEIVNAMQVCPLLEYVAILFHANPSSIWVEFHPSRCPERPEPRLVRDNTYVESERMPRPLVRRW